MKTFNFFDYNDKLMFTLKFKDFYDAADYATDYNHSKEKDAKAICKITSPNYKRVYAV